MRLTGQGQGQGPLPMALAMALALWSAAGPVQAAGNLLLIEAPPAASTLAAGPALWVLPRYPGARSTSAMLLPGFDYSASSGLFVSTDTGLGWNLSRRADLQAGVRLWPQFGRRQADMPAGIPAIGTRLQAEVFANYAPLPVLLLQAGALRGAGRHHDGTQVELGATSGLPLGEDLIGIGVAATFANAAYRQSYFGVSADQAATSGLRAHNMAAGWQDASLTFSAEHHFGPGWRISGQWVVSRLLGTAATSPLTASARQSALTMTLWHAF